MPVLGDSKSSSDAQNPWLPLLKTSLTGNHPLYDRITANSTLAVSGSTTTTLKNGVDSWLAGYTPSPTPEFVLINIGRNGWIKSDVAYVVDAIHVKWPNAHVLLCRIWSTISASPTINNVDIPDLISTRSSWLFLGPDERVFLEGGDNGALETYDGTHYTAFGAQQAAAAWKIAMGF